MSCYHPLKAFDTGMLTDNLKPKYKIMPFDTVSIQTPRSVSSRYNPGVDKKVTLDKDGRRCYYDLRITKYIPIPCGQCIGCRLDHSRMWADRCLLESKQYEHNAFVTLTYDPEHLPELKPVTDINTGEMFMWPSLVPDELTKFMKDLRMYYKHHYNHDGIRFYACGEYGSEGGRPHFHLIIFNLPIYDKAFWFRRDNMNYFTSETLFKIWHKKGIVTISDVTWNSAAYVARYVVKKQKGITAGLVDLPGDRLVTGIEPEFVRMSRKPGIAYKYYDENKHKFYETDEIVMSVRGKARTIKPPRYFDKLYDIDCEDPFVMADIKERRADNAKRSMEDQLKHTDLKYDDYLKVKERNKLAQVERLRRKMHGGVV